MSTKRVEKRTYRDRAEYLKMAVTKRRRVLKLRATETMGGGFSRSWASIEVELKKCILVCANCHREVELGLHKKEVVDQLHRQLHSL